MSTTDLISAWLLEYDARRRQRGKGYLKGKVIAGKKEQTNVPIMQQPEHHPRRSSKGRFESHIQ